MAELTTATGPEEAVAASADEAPATVTPETVALRKVQGALAKPAVVKTARAMSLFGEHAGGWLAIGAIGALVDRQRRGEWLTAAAGVAVAHGASIAIKRVVRRRRPSDPEVQVLVGTPSKLSFPSSHATSTTAAAVLYGGLTGKKLTPALVPPMMVSRLVLGVHYPSDVVAGSALGGAVAWGVRRFMRRRRNRG
ncbi:5'-phosphoribosyl-monophospho-decaprenol phosphatase [Saccharopolyspora antimicrobica]|uniref:5'-phosphoribosyl-monophospho-decaprenol phosphatase n=1 Tax=Saccharopolyspora antimicrobica TaxID=455193 RepID=A0A1I4X1T8_9PSEU|nr:5'-phosphoribosyl-monophospho-decaprenol phosphatase [Saccharopolyspora antimicrobica]SFN19330.1 5'-phosphoribosyl-monophospho-decaprenol phosphatase [Saccharopolyspora antimicrobica]